MASAKRRICAAGLLWAIVSCLPRVAPAVPAFAGQTGQPCAACHVGGFGPQLTPFGRGFKLNGYTLSTHDGRNLPFAAMLVAGFTHTRRAQSQPAADHFDRNDNLAVQEVSGFLATRLGDHAGVFAQVTYSGIEHQLAWDNTDLRFAKTFTAHGHGGVFGLSLNNNPTVQDVWNNTPAWKFPFVSSELAPGPIATPVLDGRLAQQVVGATGYLYLDDNFYAEAGAYRTLPRPWLRRLGTSLDASTPRAAPYWRAAWSHDWDAQSLSLGALGFAADLQPPGQTGRSDHFRDLGLTANYQFLGDRHIFAFDGSLIRERQRLDATFDGGGAEHPHDSLMALSLAASYYYSNTYGVTLAAFSLHGSRDALLYAAAPDTGSANGSPDTRGSMVQFDWTPFGKDGSKWSPWANLRLGAQYTHYGTFNGARRNYDGFGRNARDNDTLFVFLWTAI
ncbi:MAG TPA: cytochrome C [Rhodanobacteraceae bacterium]|nr:cytochrome C [Rhodanobacteraceae bacterium]